MKQRLRRLTAFLSAAALASASVLGAAAQNYYGQLDDGQKNNSTLLQTIQINKPYLNITLDKDDGLELPNGFYFTLKKDGAVVGQFYPGMNGFTFAGNSGTFTDPASGKTIYDITSIKNDKDLKDTLDAKGFHADQAFDRISASDYTRYNETLLSVNPNGSKTSLEDTLWEGDKIMLDPNSSCYFGYFDWDKYVVPGSQILSVEPNQAIVTVSDRYFERNDYTNIQVLDPANVDDPIYSNTLNWKREPSDGGAAFNIDKSGEYIIKLGETFSNASRDLIVSGNWQTYKKVRVPMSLLNNSNNMAIDANGIFTAKSGNKYDLRKPQEQDPKIISYCFVSGSVVSCDAPDANGYLELWVNEDDPYTQLHYVCYDRYTNDDVDESNTGKNLPYELTYDRIETKMEYPDSGITLYNVPAGKYTVEIGYTDYELSGKTSLEFQDIRDLQKMNIKIKQINKEPEKEPDKPNDPGSDTPTKPDNKDPNKPGTTPSEPSKPTPSEPSGGTPSRPSETTPSEPNGGTTSKPGTGSGTYEPSGGGNSQQGSTVTQKPQDQQPAATGAGSASLALAAVGIALAVVSFRKNSEK